MVCNYGKVFVRIDFATRRGEPCRWVELSVTEMETELSPAQARRIALELLAAAEKIDPAEGG
jgi:hypothetical protein